MNNVDFVVVYHEEIYICEKISIKVVCVEKEV